jgi:hypothetical protein
MEYLICIACGAQERGDGQWQRQNLLEFLKTPLLYNIVNGIKSADKVSEFSIFLGHLLFVDFSFGSSRLSD